MPMVGKGKILIHLNKSWYPIPLASDSFCGSRLANEIQGGILGVGGGGSVWRVILGNIPLLLKHEGNNCPSADGCYVWSDGWGRSSLLVVMKAITQSSKPTH